MAFILQTVRRCSEHRFLRLLMAALLCLIWPGLAVHAQAAGENCKGTLYLTLDTGAMQQAEAIAAILNKYQVKATFFLANEKTFRGDHALDPSWAAFWQARVAEGHQFGSHTFDHVYFKPQPVAAGLHAARPQFGERAGQNLMLSDAQVCEELDRVGQQFQSLTGRALAPLWRAPGGKAPEAVMAAARSCGYQHVYWPAAGFLGDELPSDKYPNALLLQRALRNLRDGDVLMAHLGIWSRKDAFGPMLDPLIAGLRQKGFCFATLDAANLPPSAHSAVPR